MSQEDVEKTGPRVSGWVGDQLKSATGWEGTAFLMETEGGSTEIRIPMSLLGQMR